MLSCPPSSQSNAFWDCFLLLHPSSLFYSCACSCSSRLLCGVLLVFPCFPITLSPPPTLLPDDLRLLSTWARVCGRPDSLERQAFPRPLWRRGRPSSVRSLRHESNRKPLTFVMGGIGGLARVRRAAHSDRRRGQDPLPANVVAPHDDILPAWPSARGCGELEGGWPGSDVGPKSGLAGAVEVGKQL